MGQTVLKETHCSTIQNAMGGTWHQQVGTAFREMLGIGWRTNVFPYITAVLTLQVGFMAHTRQSSKVWSLVKSVITGQTTAATGITLSE